MGSAAERSAVSKNLGQSGAEDDPLTTSTEGEPLASAERNRTAFVARMIFIGPEGLRAGWRFLLFALGIVLGAWFVEKPLAQFLAQRLGINLRELSAPALL